MAQFETIRLTIDDGVATVTLHRPQVRNAFNDVMLAELVAVFKSLAAQFPNVRVVVLTGSGSVFCAGADLNWMRKTASYSLEENLADARQLAECMYRLYTLPQPTIARVNGAAIGGGMGLVCACDLAIAQEDATFSLSEVKIGLVPACISPYVLKKVGEGRCREFFLTGERLSAQRAKEAGLINEVVSAEELDARLQERVNLLLANGPQALATCKSLLAAVSQLPLEEARDYTAHVISELRLGQEAQEGMAAFLEKRRPSWLKQ